MKFRNSALVGAGVAAIGLFAGSAMRAQDQVIRVAEADARKAVISKVEPQYPPAARQLKISGRVQMDALVGTDGTVESVQAVSGNPVLTAAAASALKQWKFSPFTAAGKPVKAMAGVAFEFRL